MLASACTKVFLLTKLFNPAPYFQPSIEPGLEVRVVFDETSTSADVYPIFANNAESAFKLYSG